MSPTFRGAATIGLSGGIVGGVISALLNYFVLPFPESAFGNAIGHGIGGFICGFIGGFMGIVVYAQRHRQLDTVNVTPSIRTSEQQRSLAPQNGMFHRKL